MLQTLEILAQLWFLLIWMDLVKERSFPSNSKLLYKSASGGVEHIRIFKV